jgi:hypothetical protein
MDLDEMTIFGSAATVNVENGHPAFSTVWGSRAWTFQEWALSRRRLVFLERQVYWSCRCKYWMEENEVEDKKSQLIWGDSCN